MYLGQASGEDSNVAVKLGMTAAKYAAQWGAEMMGFASFAAPIGIAIGFIGTIIGLLMRSTPEMPSAKIGIALPKTQVPTVGTCMLAATHFRVTKPGGTQLPAEGAIVMSVDVGDFPETQQKVEQTEPQVAEYQQKMLTPFFLTIMNLTAERQLAISNTLMKPPLWNADDQFYKGHGVSPDYTVWGLSMGGLDYGVEAVVKNGYSYFTTILNDAFLRRIYRSVLDSPALTPEEYGQIVGEVPQENDTTASGEVSQQYGPTAPVTLPSTNYLPLIALGAVALYAGRGR